MFIQLSRYVNELKTSIWNVFVTLYCLLVLKLIKTLLKYSLKDLKPVLDIKYLNGIFISNLRATLSYF